MAWLAANFEIQGQYVELLSDALMAEGAIYVDVTDAHATTQFEHALYAEPGQLSELNWSNSRLSAVFNADSDIRERITEAFAAIGYTTIPTYRVVEISDQDWVSQAKSQFQPLHISNRIWVVPSWHTPKDMDAINIRIDPGRAFGTGSHPSTSLCLQWLDASIRGGESLLDYGCGSGILAIAATKLGAQRTVGVDIDVDALAVSEFNAEINSAQIDFRFPDSLTEESFDIVIANILANPLKVLAPLLSKLVRSEGHLVLSGLLVNQEDEIRTAYQDWICISNKYELDGWICLVGRRK